MIMGMNVIEKSGSGNMIEGEFSMSERKVTEKSGIEGKVRRKMNVTMKSELEGDIIEEMRVTVKSGLEGDKTGGGMLLKREGLVMCTRGNSV